MHVASPQKINHSMVDLENIALFHETIKRVVERSPGLPGMATFYGPSGYGKTFSAVYGANKYNALYVELGESWTKKRFLQALLTELGLPVKGTIADLMDRVIEGLAVTGKPLIIDEFDHAIAKGYLESVREIHDKTGAAVVLIGEEKVPQKIKDESERFHNRILVHTAALPCSLDDAVELAAAICPNVRVGDDLLEKFVKVCHGRVRRIVINIESLRHEAALTTMEIWDLAAWGSRPFYTGNAPAQRKVGE